MKIQYVFNLRKVKTKGIYKMPLKVMAIYFERLTFWHAFQFFLCVQVILIELR